MLDDEVCNISEKVDANLTTLVLRCTFFKTFGKPYDFEEEIELRLSAKDKINEITLKEEAENNKDKLLNHLLDGENKFSKLLNDLEYQKHDALNDIAVLESKLIKLEIPPERTDRIKNSLLFS